MIDQLAQILFPLQCFPVIACVASPRDCGYCLCSLGLYAGIMAGAFSGTS